MKRTLIYIMLLFATLSFSQEKDKKYIAKGNKAFNGKDYKAAEADYRVSGSKSAAGSDASYNLGNAIYKQGQEVEAGYAYAKAIENSEDKKLKHKAYHNLGNVLMKEKDYQHAVEAYRNALRNNPYDDETRYNFALARKMLKENPPKEQPPQNNKDNKKDNKEQNPEDKGGGGNNNDQKDKVDQGDQKEKNKNDGKGDQKDKDQGKDKQGQGGENGDQQQDAPNPDKQRMENILDAMNNEEKKVQDKVNAKKVKIQPRQPEKDW